MNKEVQIYKEAHLLFEQMLRLGTFPVHDFDQDLDHFSCICLGYGNIFGDFRYQKESYSFHVPEYSLVENGTINIRPFAGKTINDIWEYPHHPGLLEYSRFRLRIYNTRWERNYGRIRGGMNFIFVPNNLTVCVMTDFPAQDYPKIKIQDRDLNNILRYLANIRENLDKTWVPYSNIDPNTLVLKQ